LTPLLKCKRWGKRRHVSCALTATTPCTVGNFCTVVECCRPTLHTVAAAGSGDVIVHPCPRDVAVDSTSSRDSARWPQVQRHRHRPAQSIRLLHCRVILADHTNSLAYGTIVSFVCLSVTFTVCTVAK